MIKVLLALILPTLVFGQVVSGQAGHAQVLGTSTTADYLTGPRSLVTQSSFEQKIITRTSRLEFTTKYTDNPEVPYGSEKILTPGVNGLRKETFETTLWQGKEIGHSLIKTEEIPPQDELVERGTKVVWQEANINGANIKYWRKINVWATSYDGHCAGCLGRTWAGTEVTLGTCAVDPKVIVMGSRFYVPGYGICRAEDIGGAIKGNHVDLGFPDVKNGFWSARHVDIYLLDGEP
ncbi:MAG: G5 domain-containing protein [Patescibacteria group bacterium]|nr:G5 domain-containing protein [Patescibacteria group bacterium]